MGPEKRTQTQVATIDAARGIFAIAVMVYHLLYFNGIAQVERIAYYAVYGFFVISGFALYITYCDRLATIHDLRAYFIKRFFRIAPLYFVVLIARLCVPPLPGDLFYR